MVFPQADSFYGQKPLAHRSGLTAADSGDPANDTGFLNSGGHAQVDFFVDTSAAVGLTRLKLRVLYANPTDSKIYRGMAVDLNDAADLVNPVVAFEARGRSVWCKVEAMTITSGSISIGYSFS